MLRRRSLVCALGTSAVAIAGCSVTGTGRTGYQPTNPHASLVSPRSTVAPTPSASRRASDSLIAYGALQSIWDKYHATDSRYAPHSSYDRTPGIAQPSSPQDDDRYYDVSQGHPPSGRVLYYSVLLAPQTTKDEAGKFIGGELPSDAKVVWQQVKDACFQREMSSETLASALVGISDASGRVLETWTSGPIGGHWNPLDVNFINLLPGKGFDSPGSISC